MSTLSFGALLLFASTSATTGAAAQGGQETEPVCQTKKHDNEVTSIAAYKFESSRVSKKLLLQDVVDKMDKVLKM
jgi:hypothetical protein